MTSEPFIKFITATVFVFTDMHYRWAHGLSGDNRSETAAWFRLSFVKIKTYCLPHKTDCRKYSCKLGDHMVNVKLVQESLSNIWRKIVILIVEKQSCWAYWGWNNFPYSGGARLPGPHQSCIINALDKNIDNPRTARDENSPDLN